jgi:sec-independent protein translocase protein TatB
MFPEGRLLDFIIVGAVALIVVGPKDLPILMRKVGQFIARMRGMAAEFRASFDELARQSELDELRKEVEALRTASPLQAAADASGVSATFNDINNELSDTNLQMHPAMGYLSPEVAEPAVSAEPPAIDPAPVMTPLAPAPVDAPPKTPRKPRAASAEGAAKPRAPRSPRKAKADEITP